MLDKNVFFFCIFYVQPPDVSVQENSGSPTNVVVDPLFKCFIAPFAKKCFILFLFNFIFYFF